MKSLLALPPTEEKMSWGEGKQKNWDTRYIFFFWRSQLLELQQCKLLQAFSSWVESTSPFFSPTKQDAVSSPALGWDCENKCWPCHRVGEKCHPAGYGPREGPCAQPGPGCPLLSKAVFCTIIKIVLLRCLVTKISSLQPPAHPKWEGAPALPQPVPIHCGTSTLLLCVPALCVHGIFGGL